MIEITCNDRLGKKVRIKCNDDDTIGDLKKLVAAQTGTKWDKIQLKKWSDPERTAPHPSLQPPSYHHLRATLHRRC